MYPDLSYIFHDLFGTNPDNWSSIFKTFGLFLGLTFFVIAYILYLEFKRKEKEGILLPTEKIFIEGGGPKISDIISNAIVGFILGFKIPYIISHFDAFKENAAGIVFSSLGNLPIGILVALAFGGYYFWLGKKAQTEKPTSVKRLVYPHQKVGDIIVVAAISGIIGSRLFSILENMESFLADPIGNIFSGSGLTVYGGLILGFICVFIYVKRNGIPPIHVMDAIAPALMLGYAFGRMGCHFSGDGDWGIVAAKQPDWWFFPDWAWAYHYPNNVADFYQSGAKIEGCTFKFCTYLDPPVYPTSLYEIVVGILLFGLLWFLRKRIKVAGALFFAYITLNGLERFFIEKIRVNERYDLLGLNWSQAQYISILMILIGIGGFVFLYRKAAGKKN